MIEIFLPIVVVLIVLSAMFCLSDMAISSVNVLRLKKAAEEGNKKAKIAYKLAINYDNTISSILFGNNLTNIGISSLMVSITASFSFSDIEETIISIVISVFVLLLFGEIVPKSIAKIYNYKLSLFFAYPIYWFQWICYPITWVLTKFANAVSKLFMRSNKENNVDVDLELQEMVSTIEDEGIIDEDKADILRNAIDFTITEAYEIMTPRVDLIMFDINDDVQELLNDKDYFIYSRIPIYNEDKDDVIGILPIKSVQKKMLIGEDVNIKELMYEPLFIPESMKIDEVLKIFRKQKMHIAVVLDEFGGVEGIVTMEDILEELVGQIFDETDEIEQDYSETKDGFIVDGSMNIEDFFELVELKVDIDEEEFTSTTVAGWCVELLNRFAQVGDKLEYENLKITVIAVDEYTIEKIRVKINKVEVKKENFITKKL